MERISHRGYHVDVPENTLEAFSRAVELGVDGIETDLRLSADGAVVLFHDRVLDDGREVAAVSHAELCRQAGCPVPRLEEALERFSNITWMLEIKAAAALEPALPIIRRFASTHRFQITSFLHPVIERARGQVEAELGLLVAHRPANLAGPPPGWDPRGAGIACVVWKYEVVDAELIAAARRLGLKNYVYGVETREDHRRSVDELPLDGVISDRPEWLPAAPVGRAA